MELKAGLEGLTLAQRHARAQQLLEENPLRVPVVLVGLEERLPAANRQLLIPRAFKVAQFAMKVRKLIELSQDDALFFFSGKGLLQQDKVIGHIYDDAKNDDGFLYIRVSCAPAFGAFTSMSR